MTDQQTYKYVTGLRTTIKAQLHGTPSDIIEYIKCYGIGYEIIDGQCVPYFDFDFKYDTLAEQERNEENDYTRAVESIEREYASRDGKLYILQSCGLDTASYTHLTIPTTPYIYLSGAA